MFGVKRISTVLAFSACLCLVPPISLAQTTITAPLKIYSRGVAQYAAFSPDGSKLAIAGSGGIDLLQMPSGLVVRSISHEQAADPAFSPDGRILATCGVTSVSTEVNLWEVATGAHIRSFGVPLVGPIQVKSPTFSPDGSRILTMSYDGTYSFCILWKTSTGARLMTYQMPYRQLYCCQAFSPDGKRIATVSCGGSITLKKSTLHLWDVASTTPLRRYPAVPGEINSVAFSPDGKRIFTAGGDAYAPILPAGEVRSWDAASQKCLWVYTPHEAPVKFLAISRDGERIVTGNGSETRVWNSDLSEKLGEFPPESLACSADASRILIGNGDDLCLWSTTSGSKLQSIGDCCRSGILSLSFSPTRMLTVTEMNSMLLWDVQTRARVMTYSPRDGGAIVGAALSPDGSRIFATFSDNGGGLLWDATTTIPLAAYPDAFGAVAFSPDRKTILTGRRDGSLGLWDVSTSQTLRHVYQLAGVNLSGDGGAQLSTLCFSGDGKRFLSACGRTSAILWDVESGECLANYQASGLYIRSIALSANGERAILGAEDGVHVWDTMSGDAVKITGQGAQAVALSPDGQKILTGSRSLKLWDIDGTCLRVFYGHDFTNPVNGLAFSPDGKRAFSAGGDGMLLQWSVPGPTRASEWEWY